MAFQITNICRDITEDAVAGRVYLPSDKLAGVGVAATPGAILAVENQPAVFSVASDLLTVAEAYYRSSRAGLRFPAISRCRRDRGRARHLSGNRPPPKAQRLYRNRRTHDRAHGGDGVVGPAGFPDRPLEPL